MSGFVQIAGKCHINHIVLYSNATYIPVSDIRFVTKYISLTSVREKWPHLPNKFVDVFSDCDVYVLNVDNDCYVVDSSEAGRMGKILDGSANPIHALVTELQYNPHVGLRVRAAQADFDRKRL